MYRKYFVFMLYPSALVNLELNHNHTFAQLHEEEDG